MKIYKNFYTISEKELYPGTKGFEFEIEFVKPMGKYSETSEEDAIIIGLLDPSNEPKRQRHAIIGRELQDEFKKDMNVSKIEELVGKKVIAYVNEHRFGLAGISVYKE